MGGAASSFADAVLPFSAGSVMQEAYVPAGRLLFAPSSSTLPPSGFLLNGFSGLAVSPFREGF